MQRFRNAQWLALCIAGTALVLAQENRTPRTPGYSDQNLLPPAGPHIASTMLLPLFVSTRSGTAPREFTEKDFTLLVDGIPAKAKIERPWNEEGRSCKHDCADHILLVLPPNQPLLHNMATEDAIRYFSKQEADGQGRLPWDISIFDSNAKQTAFTRDKGALLAGLEASRKTVQPLEPSADLGGNWLEDARNSISRMQFLPGRRIVVAFDPQLEPVYGLLEYSLMQTDPSDLVGAAERAGAQVYLANTTGPAYVGPAGSGLNTALAGTPISGMMQSSGLTGAGYANSLKDLFGQIIADRDKSYVLKFHIRPDNLDDSSLKVKVRILNRNLKAVVLQPLPDPSSRSQTAVETASAGVPRPLLDALDHPVASPDLRIAQHIDYFPEKNGMAAVLPFSCALVWTGDGEAPRKLIVVERVERANSGFVVLSHKLTLSWNGRFASWERDNKLSPGAYRWKIAVADGAGTLLASAVTETKVPRPAAADVQASTLVTGVNCRRSIQDKSQSMNGLRSRGPHLHASTETPTDAVKDPLLETNCLLEPNPLLFYRKDDVLRALVRIYLSGKVDKGSLDAWHPTFELLDHAGRIESEQQTRLTIDSAPGYLAAVKFRLDGEAVSRGIHSVKLELRGPGIKQPLIRLTEIMIQ